MEVYEAVEIAVTQLDNLNAVQYLKDDFGLMSKIVLKLPAADQRQYTQYVTSDVAKADSSSRWEKFWKWLEKLHESAVQASLMYMCDKTSLSKTTSGGNLKSGISCHTCGGIGHYARTCSSKPKASAGGPSIKVNMAVAKISSKEDYNKYIGETKKEIGKCPACQQGPHNYTRNFPFGKAEWPSNRLESCPQFIAKSVRERGELIEKVKGCYKCTSFKHLGDGCFTRRKANCNVMSGGVACAGAHHKLLHGSSVAFCHKL